MILRRVDLIDVRRRVEHLERMELARVGGDGGGWEAVFTAGPQVILWRRFRDGTETEERLPLFLAEITLASIPEDELGVARAKIVRGHK